MLRRVKTAYLFDVLGGWRPLHFQILNRGSVSRYQLNVELEEHAHNYKENTSTDIAQHEEYFSLELEFFIQCVKLRN